MRQFGLILENLDGCPRKIPCSAACRTRSRCRPRSRLIPAGPTTRPASDDSTVVEATGWSGDGAPGDGSLRSFAIGAVVQHFPKTLNRIAGKDFRLPTKAELDAMEAFQLSLGRQTDLNLAAMHFGTSGPATAMMMSTRARACSLMASMVDSATPRPARPAIETPAQPTSPASTATSRPTWRCW